MKLITPSLLAISASLSSALIFNKTAAYTPGQLDKYRCIDTEGVNDLLPECLHQCQRNANSQDGCGYDDFACHCSNYDVYSPIIESCAFPPALGGTGTCNFTELGQARAVVTDLCNFFNATLYMADVDCKNGERHGWHDWHWRGRGRGLDLTPDKTFEVIAAQEITILDE